MARINPSRKSKDDGTEGKTFKKRIACGKIRVTVNVDDDAYPIEVMLRTVDGGCAANQETIGRLITLLMECNVDLDHVLHQMNKVICRACKTTKAKKPDEEISLSCSKAVAECLQIMIDKWRKNREADKEGEET